METLKMARHRSSFCLSCKILGLSCFFSLSQDWSSCEILNKVLVSHSCGLAILGVNCLCSRPCFVMLVFNP